MPEWVWTILNFIFGIPRMLFGDRVDEAWGIVAATYVTLIAIAFVILGARAIRYYLKALDFRFSMKRQLEYNASHPDDKVHIDWTEAYRQLVRSWRFSIPFGILVLVVTYWWVAYDFTLETYFKLAVGWLVFQFFLRLWWIAVATWSERKLIRKDEMKIEDSQTCSWSVIRSIGYYFTWGLQKGAPRRRRGFRQLLKFANPIIWLFRLRWLQPRLLLPLFGNALWSAFWPVTMVYRVIDLSKDFNETSNLLRPWWYSKSNKQQPPTNWPRPEAHGGPAPVPA